VDVPPLHVDASATAAGAGGSLAHPYVSLPQAVAAAPNGATLLVAAGTYAPIAIAKHLCIVGRCPHLTRIDAGDATHAVDVTGPETGGAAAVVLQGVQLLGQNRGLRVAKPADMALRRAWLKRLRGLAIQTRDGGHLQASDGVGSGTLSPDTGGNAAFVIGNASSAVLQRVRVAMTAGDGLRVEANSQLLAEQLVVDGTAPSTDGESRGFGLMVHAMSTATIHRVLVADTHAEGVSAYGLGVEVTLTGALVTGAGGPKLGKVEWAAGIEANATAKRDVRATVVATSTGLGVHCKEPGTQLTATGLVVRDTRPIGTGEMGNGAYVRDGCTAKGRFWWFAGNRSAGLVTENSGTTAMLADLTVRDTQPTQANEYGLGALVFDGAHATIERARIHNNLFAGVVVDDGGELTLRRALVSPTHVEQASAFAGHGIDVFGTQAPSQAVVEDTVVRLNQNIGVFVDDAGSELTMRRCTVLNTGAGVVGKNEGRGIGIEARYAAKLVLEDVRSHNNRRFGVVVAGKAELQARRLIADQTQPDVLTGVDGRGVLVSTGAKASIRTTRLHRNHVSGFSCDQPGTRAALLDALIDGTWPDYLNGTGGMGVYLRDECEATLVGSRLHANHLAGLTAGQTQAPVVLRGVLVDQTQVDDANMTTVTAALGFIDAAGASEIRSSRLVGSVGASLYAYLSRVDLFDTVLGEVASRDFPGYDAAGNLISVENLSDGLSATSAHRLHATRVLVYGQGAPGPAQQRAGRAGGAQRDHRGHFRLGLAARHQARRQLECHRERPDAASQRSGHRDSQPAAAGVARRAEAVAATACAPAHPAPSRR
jgi:hypothetical protein